LRLDQNTQLYFNPEIAGGKGLSNVNGLANAAQRELPRVQSATPKPYIARLYLSHDFGFGSEKEHTESDLNQLAGERPMKRYTITAGRFTVTDFFDNNNYTHDPRLQFLAWGVMYNGAWDYPADTRGYTWGIVMSSIRAIGLSDTGAVAEPRVANGGRFDRRVFRDRGDTSKLNAAIPWEIQSWRGSSSRYLNHHRFGQLCRCPSSGGSNRDDA